MSQVTEFTVERAKWSRGGKNGPTRLLNGEGNMCCLGFLGEACGVPRGALGRAAFPSTLRVHYGRLEYPGWLFGPPTTSTRKMREDDFTEINDNPNISDAKRERLLAEEFAKHGITVRFV